ncbi:MAG: hypothetical protein LC632_06735 [Xanthomonadaceae bacterium]|nr:hypothetical protein [Xanthomonadaceae bacterium]
MKNIVLVGALAGVLLLGGCASGPRSCPEPGDYAAASPANPYTVPEGMERPSPAGRLAIPQGHGTVPAGLQGNRYQAADGSVLCLEQPPPMRRDLLRAQ